MEETFWIVLADNSNYTARRHQSFDLANREAECLAALNPEIKYYVLKARGYHMARKPSTWTELADIPL